MPPLTRIPAEAPAEKPTQVSIPNPIRTYIGEFRFRFGTDSRLGIHETFQNRPLLGAILLPQEQERLFQRSSHPSQNYLHVYQTAVYKERHGVMEMLVVQWASVERHAQKWILPSTIWSRQPMHCKPCKSLALFAREGVFR